MKNAAPMMDAAFDVLDKKFVQAITGKAPTHR